MKKLIYLFLLLSNIVFGQNGLEPYPGDNTIIKLRNKNITGSDTIYSYPLSNIFTASEGVNKVGNDFRLGYNLAQYNSFSPNNILERRYFKVNDGAGLHLEVNGTSVSNSLIILENQTDKEVGISMSTRNSSAFFQPVYGNLKLEEDGSLFTMAAGRNIELRTSSAAPLGEGAIFLQARRLSVRNSFDVITLTCRNNGGQAQFGRNDKQFNVSDVNYQLTGVPVNTAYSNILTIDPATGELRQAPATSITTGGGSSTTTNVLERVGGSTPAMSNFLRSTVNGVSSNDVAILNNAGISYNHGTGDLTWGANGFTVSTNLSALKTPTIINTLGLVGNTLTSTVNGVVASTVLPGTGSSGIYILPAASGVSTIAVTAGVDNYVFYGTVGSLQLPLANASLNRKLTISNKNSNSIYIYESASIGWLDNHNYNRLDLQPFTDITIQSDGVKWHLLNGDETIVGANYTSFFPNSSGNYATVASNTNPGWFTTRKGRYITETFSHKFVTTANTISNNGISFTSLLMAGLSPSTSYNQQVLIGCQVSYSKVGTTLLQNGTHIAGYEFKLPVTDVAGVEYNVWITRTYYQQ